MKRRTKPVARPRLTRDSSASEISRYSNKLQLRGRVPATYWLFVRVRVSFDFSSVGKSYHLLFDLLLQLDDWRIPVTAGRDGFMDVLLTYSNEVNVLVLINHCMTAAEHDV